jgi:hypothetical protein
MIMSDIILIVAIVAVFIIAVTILVVAGKAQNRKNLQKLVEYANKRGYKLYPAKDMEKFLKILEPTAFYKSITTPFMGIKRKAFFYNIIDTGKEKFTKLCIHGRRGHSVTYSIYVGYVEAPDIMIVRIKNKFLAQGFTQQFYSKYGYVEINIPGLTGDYYVFGKDANAVLKFLENKVQALKNQLGDYSIEVADNIFICYNHYQKVKLEHYDAVIEQCRKIKSVLEQ